MNTRYNKSIDEEQQHAPEIPCRGQREEGGYDYRASQSPLNPIGNVFIHVSREIIHTLLR